MAQYTSLPVSNHPGSVLRALELPAMPFWFAYLSERKVFEHTNWDVRSADELMRYADAMAARLAKFAKLVKAAGIRAAAGGSGMTDMTFNCARLK